MTEAMKFTQTQSDHAVPDMGFESHASVVSLHVRQSLAEVCAHLGADSTKPRLFARQMGWNKNLAWKVSRIVTGEDLLAAIPLLPGKSGQQTMLKTFAAAGVPERSIEAVRSALAEFESMVVTHAGDRDTFQKMLTDLTDVGQQERDEAHRKMAFEGNSAFWGVQARVRLSCNVVSPNNSTDLLDWATMSGMMDFRRLRSNIAWTVTGWGTTHDTGELLHARGIAPLDPAITDPRALPLAREFCSENLPPLRAMKGTGIQTLYRITEGPVGTQGQFSCIMGWVQKSALPRRQTPTDRIAEFVVPMSTPVELLHFDMFMHRSLEYAMNPEMRMFSLLPGEPMLPDETKNPENAARTRLPFTERITNVPTNPLDATAAEMPEYPRMVRWMFERLGKNPAEYRGFRFRQRYPMLSTQMAFRHELPEA